MDLQNIVPILLLLFFMLSFPLLIQYTVNRRIKGKHLCVILEKGRPLTIKLLPIVGDDFIKDGKDEWILQTNLMKPVTYPIGWPKILGAFQHTVWCSLVLRGRSAPLDWENPEVGALSSKELPVILDPHWLINLVKGVGEEGQASVGSNLKMFVMLSLGVGAVCLIMTFFVIYKLGIIEKIVASGGIGG